MPDPGAVLKGQYRIERELARGSMGGVYEATRMASMARVVIKEMAVGAAPDDVVASALKLFHQETDVLRRLKHPNLPVVYEVFEENGVHYLVTELVSGNTLASLVEKHGPRPESPVLDWARQLCDALECLHGQTPPIVHRDLNPANVMLTENGTIKLIGFGLGRFLGGSAQAAATSMIMGAAATPAYSPLEQHANKIDARTDVYALGATLFHLLTGKVPSTATELITGRASADPRKLQPEVTEATADGIVAMMQNQLSLRLQSISDVRSALRLVSNAPTIEETWSEPLPSPDARDSGTRWRYVALALLAVVVIGAGLALRSMFRAAPPTAPPPAPPQSRTIVAGIGMGDARLGMHFDVLQRKQKPVAIQGIKGSWRLPSLGVRIAVAKGIVTLVSIHDADVGTSPGDPRQWQTPQGVHLGTKREDVQRVLPPAKTIDTRFDYPGMRIFFNNGTVSEIDVQH